MSDTQTIERTETVTRTMPMHRLLLHNDDHNSCEHVLKSLVEVFKFDHQKAMTIMMEAHETDVALILVTTLERCELYHDQMQALGITTSIEPEG
jgi:ATP-dependent Clp protease adaptor protein ClpS